MTKIRHFRTWLIGCGQAPLALSIATIVPVNDPMSFRRGLAGLHSWRGRVRLTISRPVRREGVSQSIFRALSLLAELTTCFVVRANFPNSLTGAVVQSEVRL